MNSRIGLGLGLLLCALTTARSWGAPDAHLFDKASVAFHKLTTESPYLSYDSSMCGGVHFPMVDEPYVCARKTVAELLTWSLGADCEGEAHARFLANLAVAIDEKISDRKKIRDTLRTIPRDVLEQVFEETPEHRTYHASLERYVDTQRSLSARERALLYSYFQTGYLRINGALREGGRVAECASPLVDALRAALGKLRRHEGTVWRGTHFPKVLLGAYAAGAEVTWPAFSSTSLSRRVAESFANSHSTDASVLFEIHARSCVDARGASHKLTEEEVLCPPGMRLRVLKHEIGEGERHVITLEEI